MAPSLPPNPQFPPRPVAPQPQFQQLPPQASPAQMAQALRVQRLSQILPQHSGGISMELRPYNVHFATQNKGEKVFILLRRHFITNLGWIFSTGVYVALPILLHFVLNFFGQSITGIFGLRLSLLLAAVYYALVLTNALRNFVDWYFNIYIVTDERVINYSFQPFVSRDITELSLQDIEDIKEADVGILEAFFNYGNVSVYTAADESVITFHFVPSPQLVRDKISDLSKIVKSLRNEP